MKHSLLCCLLLGFLCCTVHAQADSTKYSVKLSINANSNFNYYGRTDSIPSSGIFPMVEIWAPSGWYLNAAPIFITGQTLTYAGMVATLGCQKISEKWAKHFFVLKPIYTADARLVQSALKMQTGFTLTRLHRFLNVTLGADLKFSDKADLGATAGIDHIFYIRPEKMNLLVDPSFYIYAGTQQFSKTYTAKKTRGNYPFQADDTRSGSQFNVLAYELSVPVIYTRKALQFTATPNFIMPQNLITVAGSPDLSEQGKNTLYLTLAAKYTF